MAPASRQLSTIRWGDVLEPLDFGLTIHRGATVSDIRSVGRSATTRFVGRLRLGLVGEERTRASRTRLDVLDADEDRRRLRDAQQGRRVRGESSLRVAPLRHVRLALRTRRDE